MHRYHSKIWQVAGRVYGDVSYNVKPALTYLLSNQHDQERPQPQIRIALARKVRTYNLDPEQIASVGGGFEPYIQSVVKQIVEDWVLHYNGAVESTLKTKGNIIQ